MYTQNSTYIHISNDIIFPLFYSEETVGSSKQFLNGTTPLNKHSKILSILSKFYTPNDEKTHAKRVLSTMLRIIVLKVANEKLVTYKDHLLSCSGPRNKIPVLLAVKLLKKIVK